MSEDQTIFINTQSCSKCNSHFNRDRICLAKNCESKEYLSFICKMCHYDEHKKLGRLKVSELDYDVFKKDLEELAKSFQNQMKNEYGDIYEKSKNRRKELKEIIEKLGELEKTLEEFETKYLLFIDQFNQSISNLKDENEELIEKSINAIFDMIELSSDTLNETEGFWKIKNKISQKEIDIIREINEIVEFIHFQIDFTDTNQTSQKLKRMVSLQEAKDELEEQVIKLSNKEKKSQLKILQEETLNQSNYLVQQITKYFINWYDYKHISMIRQSCSKCQGFYYLIFNTGITKHQISSNTLCNNCFTQNDSRADRDPRGTSTFYYYAHESTSGWIQTRNGQELYNYFIKNQQEIQKLEKEYQEETQEVSADTKK